MRVKGERLPIEGRGRRIVHRIFTNMLAGKTGTRGVPLLEPSPHETEVQAGQGSTLPLNHPDNDR
jgi:hypothetical protein